MTMKQQAACYARLSSDRDLNAASIQDQIDACRAEADRRGLTVPDHLVFVDRNLSASKRGTIRPAYQQLLDVLEKGTTDTVFVRETSRLYRQPMELEKLLELVEGKGVKVHALFSGEIDLDRGLLEARIRVAVDAEESHKLSQRVKLAKAARRAEGTLNGGGRRPYGYQRTPEGLAIDPIEASHIKDATQRLLAGESLTRVVLDFNTQGITAAGGGRWTPNHLKRVLAGRPSLRGTPLIAGGPTWPSILTADEVALLQARLTAPSKHRPKHPARGRKYPLTGILLCDLCGSHMIGSKGYYRCAPVAGGCGKSGITARTLEDHLLTRIDNLRGYQDMAGKPQPDARTTPAVPVDEEHRADLLSELHNLENRLAELGEAIADGTLSITTASAAESNLVKKHTKVQEELALSGPTKPPVLPWDVLVEQDTDWMHRFKAGDLTALEIQDLHDAFAAWIASVKVAPRPDRRKSFNPDRITVTWQPGIAGVAWSSSNTSLSH